MSLLISRDYANKDKPLWIPSTGGTVDGSLNVNGVLTTTGNIISGGNVRAEGNMSTRVYITIDPSGNSTGGLYYQSTSTGATSNGMLIQGDLLKFCKLNTGQANTSLTVSAPGANLDNFTLGGTLNCLIGPVPTQLITSTKTVNPVALSPSAPSQFGVDVSLSGISNAEYDVQATGTVFVASGTVDASDSVTYTFTSGGGLGSMTAVVFPGLDVIGGNYVTGTFGPLTAGGSAASIQMRARVSPNASGTILGANVRASSPNSSTAVYGATLTLLDVQRVR